MINISTLLFVILQGLMVAALVKLPIPENLRLAILVVAGLCLILFILGVSGIYPSNGNPKI